MGQEIVPVEEIAPDTPALRDAADQANEFIAASRSKATRRGYASDWRDFEAWCARGPLITLPAAPFAVALYLAALAHAGAKVSTIRRRAIGIAHVHRMASLDNPCAHVEVRAVLTGIRNTIGSAPSKKVALTAEHMRAVLGGIGSDLAGIRDRALILIGFAAALRRSELVALDITDIERHPKGVVIRIRRSKTDQAGVGIRKAVPHGKRLRPVAALDGWLAQLSARCVIDGPLFLGVHGTAILPRRLSDQQVAAIVKKRVAAAGLDPKLFSGHSLRSGYITSAAESGATLTKIADQAGHTKLETTRGYMQVADSFKDHSGGGFL